MTLYDGRISASLDADMDAINRSLPVDIRLLAYDVLTNRAWTDELARLGVVTEQERLAIHTALEQVAAMTFAKLPDDEDVHTLVERLVTEKVGPAGGKIHTGRSRNDQVVCDTRMFTADALLALRAELLDLIARLAELAAAHAETVFAGTTHLQPAQPITLGHFLLSLAEALWRDQERAADAFGRANQCPLGAGALAGSGFAVDREALARALGFDGVLENTLDAVADRDFAQEAAAVAAMLLVHLSRYAEQMVIWSNPAFGYVRFSDAWSTGSSMMPQKRNPDAMELVRGLAGRCIGDLTALLTLTKGVPLSYAKDLQDDKKLLFDALDTARLCTRVFREAVATAHFDAGRMAEALRPELLATDLADELVKYGVPFREAHHRVAALVTELENEAKDLSDVDAQRFAAVFPELGDQPFSFGFDDAVKRRAVRGGTAPEAVRAAIAQLRQRLDAVALPTARVAL